MPKVSKISAAISSIFCSQHLSKMSLASFASIFTIYLKISNTQQTKTNNISYSNNNYIINKIGKNVPETQSY